MPDAQVVDEARRMSNPWPICCAGTDRLASTACYERGGAISLSRGSGKSSAGGVRICLNIIGTSDV
ncbi:MAG: hypothetical protein MUE70_11435 [Desulfobacterales bacterium]|jgi:hypothetical protein|nr:hypothetical protein [Desulfobacterales bacterium]